MCWILQLCLVLTLLQYIQNVCTILYAYLTQHALIHVCWFRIYICIYLYINAWSTLIGPQCQHPSLLSGNSTESICISQCAHNHATSTVVITTHETSILTHNACTLSSLWVGAQPCRPLTRFRALNNSLELQTLSTVLWYRLGTSRAVPSPMEFPYPQGLVHVWYSYSYLALYHPPSRRPQPSQDVNCWLFASHRSTQLVFIKTLINSKRDLNLIFCFRKAHEKIHKIMGPLRYSAFVARMLVSQVWHTPCLPVQKHAIV
jgi:hypothetical protein